MSSRRTAIGFERSEVLGDQVPVHIERAHAKINLILRILAREASGYHGIETLFQRLALHDLVQVTVGDGPSHLTCDGPSMPAGGLGTMQDNLAWRAAALYTHAASWDTTWQIAIEKHIPVGGGLGGGSADAAAVLRALDALAPSPLGVDRLVELGGQLGADVPFLVAQDALGWGWHRGDRFLPLSPLPAMAVTLVTFTAGINTGAAYGAIAAERAARGTTTSSVRYRPHVFTSWQAVASYAHNDFEAVAMGMHPGVAHVLPQLAAQAERLCAAGHTAIGMMSGSGATCFLLHPEGNDIPLDLPPDARVVRTTTG